MVYSYLNWVSVKFNISDSEPFTKIDLPASFVNNSPEAFNSNDGKEVVDDHKEKSNVSQPWDQCNRGVYDVTITTLEPQDSSRGGHTCMSKLHH